MRKKTSLNFVGNLGKRPQKGSPALTYIFVNIPGGTMKIAKIQNIRSNYLSPKTNPCKRLCGNGVGLA